MKGNYDYDTIFHSYTKYRTGTFNNIMAYDNSIFKFKDRIHGFNKIQKEMEIKPSKKNIEPVEIFIKENNKKQIFKEKIQNENESKNTKDKKQENKEKEKAKTKEEADNKNLLANENTFLILGKLPDIISNSLIKRGWAKTIEIDPKLQSYQFIFTIKVADIPFDELRSEIIVNHFRKIWEITKKGNLLKNLRNLYFMNVCPDDFYPRGYDLSGKQDIEDFIEDFKTSKAIALLRNCKELNGVNVNRKEIITSLNIVKRKMNLLLGETNLENQF